MEFLGFSYHRPAQQPRGRKLSQGSEESLGHQSVPSTFNDNPLGGIPHALNFDRIVDGGTCPVCPHFEDLFRHFPYK